MLVASWLLRGYIEEVPEAVEVGVRELRNNLSRYLGQVRDGEEILVTDRGRAIARVVPVEAERALDRLVAAGIVTPAQRPRRPAGKPVTVKGTVSNLVADQRRWGVSPALPGGLTP